MMFLKALFLVTVFACAGHAQIMSAKAFEADVTVTMTMMPFPVKGHMHYDYDNQVQRIDTSMMGVSQVEVDRYDQSLKYVYASMFGQQKCNTCFLKPPLYPLYVPPGAKFMGNETIDGQNCAKYNSDFSGWGLDMNFWITNDPSTGQVITVRAEFAMTQAQITTTFDFANVNPGPQASSLFDPPGTCPPPRCAANVNVGFVVDGSTSITAPDFDKGKTFLGDTAAAFQYGSDLAAATVVQFSGNVRIELALTTSADAIMSSIGRMNQLTGGTNTALGISTTASQLTSRQASNNIMILVTDGQSNQGGDPIAAANAAKAKGIEIYCVGVGSGIDQKQLQGIASEPTKLHMFTVDDYGALQKIIKQLVSSSCPESQCNLNNSFNSNFDSSSSFAKVVAPLRGALASLPRTNNGMF